MPELTNLAALPPFSQPPFPQAVLLDRDGTINRERADYVKSWAEYEWLPGALPALVALAELDVPILVVTNQSAVGRGILTMRDLDALHEQVRSEAAGAGARLNEFFVCPHTPADRCTCRKPEPGLFLAAAAQYGLDLGRCVFVGDSVTDYQAAYAAGCPCVLLRSGRQGSVLDDLVEGLGCIAKPLQIVDDLGAAAVLIIAASGLKVEAICE